jgi:hypothetical protein
MGPAIAISQARAGSADTAGIPIVRAADGAMSGNLRGGASYFRHGARTDSVLWSPRRGHVRFVHTIRFFSNDDDREVRL